MTYKLGWFSTGRDRVARALLEVIQSSIKRGEVRAEIAFVFSTREPGESEESDRFFELLETYQIPLVYFSYQKFKRARGDAAPDQAKGLPEWRLDYDREVMQRLNGFNPDLCVLAGYMLIVGEEMCQKYNMINLHPAAPGGPIGTWQEVIWQLIESQAKETGVLMNLVTPELDRGPVVTYCTFPIRGEPYDRYWQEIEGYPVERIKQHEGENNLLFRLIRRRGVDRELPLIVATVKAFSEGRVKITPGKKVVDAAGKPMNGYDLTDEIEPMLNKSRPDGPHTGEDRKG